SVRGGWAMEFSVRFLGFLQTLLRYLAAPLYFLWSLQDVKILPPIGDPILLQSASTIAKKIRKRLIKSEDVVAAYIKRIKEVNPYLNAVVEDRFADALQDAREVDNIISSTKETEDQLEKETPLLGVPFTVKESCGLKGLSQCVGSIPRIGIKSDKDGETVKLLRKAGAIPLLVSNTPEFCLGWETNNLVTGRTLNPYNSQKTCGGSSGGEGALIGSGASVIGVGSDVAGSIRVPAMYNGIFGHKPTPGKYISRYRSTSMCDFTFILFAGYVSIDGHFPYATDANFHEYLAIGPIARYAEDLKCMLSVMAGEKASKLKLSEKVDLHSLKVYYMTDAGKSFVLLPVDQEIKKTVSTAAKHLNRKYGIPAKEVVIEEMGDSAETSISVFFGLQGIPNALEDPQNPKESHNLFLELLKAIFGASKYSLSLLLFYLLQVTNVFIPKWRYNYYCGESKKLKKKFMDILGDNSVFLYPTHPTAAYYHNQVFFKTAGVMYTMLFNVLGLPSTHVPLGLNKEGMPIGIQVIAAPHQDRLCLAVAEALEKDFGGWIPPPAMSTQTTF
ncbi:hypothetical protein ANN_17003, partial [Periplaneta americana]